jgi:hypothetical protein
VSRVGFEPTTLCLKVRQPTTRKLMIDKDFPDSARTSTPSAFPSVTANFDGFHSPTGTTTGTNSTDAERHCIRAVPMSPDTHREDRRWPRNTRAA